MPLSTAEVFAALRSPPAQPSRRPAPLTIQNADALLDLMRSRGNDLERPATTLLPVIADIKAALVASPGCRLAALSGSGPTCFGIFSEDATASHAASALAAAHPQWWVAATRLAGKTGA